MAVGYRAILRLDPNTDAVMLAEEQLRSWLREKRKRGSSLERSDWDGPGVHRLGRLADLHVVHEEHPEDNSVRRLYRLFETNPTGRYVVSVYAAALPSARIHRNTIVVEVDLLGKDRAGALEAVDPPKIVRSLLETVRAGDGSIILTGSPIVIRSGQVAEVVDAITDPERTASVIVAGSFAQDLDAEWREAVANLTKQSVGVAATYVVYADAMEELKAALPPSHRIDNGRVRTFVPRVNLADPTDSLRHKWLGPATLQRSLSGKRVALPLQRRHAEGARRRLVESELPSDVRRTLDLLRRAETGIERAARVADRVAEAPLTTPAVPLVQPISKSTEADELSSHTSGWVERIRATLARWLKTQDEQPEAIDQLDSFIATKVAEVQVAEEQLLEGSFREETLQVEIESLRARLEDMELDLAQSEDDSIRTERELSVLRQRLAASANPDTFVPPDDSLWDAPDTVEELIARITPGKESHPILNRVVFTGDPDAAIEIDRRYPSGLYARTLWQYVRVLHDYCESRATKSFSGNVHMYLNDDRVEGTKCSPTRHAATESETVLTNQSWREERVFPVPASVNSTGRALMDAHFKPTHRDTFAPRMHYLDSAAETGTIYVGYIGKHLTNKQT